MRNASRKQEGATSRYRNLVPSTLLLGGLSACGGGDDGGDSSSASDPFSVELVAGSLSLPFYSDGSTQGVVRYFYPSDFFGSSSEEVIVAGFETQPNTPEAYSDTRLHIVGFESGRLVAKTSIALGDQQSQVQGVGDVAIGDFNGDGLLDFFTSAYADMDHEVTAYEFRSAAGSFVRSELGSAEWQHGAAAGDINNDGFDDVFVAGYRGADIYMGSASGLLPFSVIGDYGGGSAVALGDFLNNGSVQAVVVDGGGVAVNDTVLFALTVDFGAAVVSLQEINRLPTPRLEGAEFAEYFSGSDERSHDVRVEALDFNNDGLLDVVVFSRGSYDDVVGEWPLISQVQFLRNEGTGVFTDVTDVVLPNYQSESYVGYVPVFGDFNGDGNLDIFISEADFSGRHVSSAFLMGMDDGTFREVGRDLLSQIIPADGGMATIIRDESGDYFILVGEPIRTSEGMQEQLTAYQVDFV